MADKDYLEMAKEDYDYSRKWERDYEDRNLDVAQAQAAATIAMAERLDKLIVATTLIAKEWQKYNERVELRIEDSKTFGENGMIFRKT